MFCPQKTPHSDINTFLQFSLSIGDADFVVRQAQDRPEELRLVIIFVIYSFNDLHILWFVVWNKLRRKSHLLNGKRKREALPFPLLRQMC